MFDDFWIDEHETEWWVDDYPLVDSPLVRFRNWLARDNAERCVLVQLDYQYELAGVPATGTLFLSDREFFDQVGLVNYIDCINSVPEFTRSLSGDRLGGYTSSIGTLEIDNADGAQDFILDLALDGSEVRFLLGDKTWPVSDFQLIFSALAMLASATAFDRISVQLKDTGLLLNKSIGGGSLVGGTGANANRARPLNFGYVHNLEALVKDNALLIYVHSDTGASTAAVAVRDRGVAVAFTDNADGTFTLGASPAGTITCDVVAFNADRNVSDAMDQLVGVRSGLTALGKYAGAGPTFVIDDADDYLVGDSIPQARNVQDILAELTDSGNCFWAIKRTGEFTYGRLRPNNIAGLGLPATPMVEDDIDQGTFRLDHLPPQYYRFQAYMSKNWIQQTDLASSLTPDEQAVYRRNGIYLLQNPGVGTTYNDAPELYNKSLAVSPVLDTLLSGAFDELDLPFLETWMETRRAMFLPWIEVASLTTGIDFYERELGDPISLTNPRFGENAGTLFQVMSITLKLSKAKIDFRLVRRRLLAPPPPEWTRITENVSDTFPQTATLVVKPTIIVVDPWPPEGPPSGQPIVVGGGTEGAPNIRIRLGPAAGAARYVPPALPPTDGYIVLEPMDHYTGTVGSAVYISGAGGHPETFYAALHFSSSPPATINVPADGTYVGVIATMDANERYEYTGTVDSGGYFLGPIIGIPAYSWEWQALSGLAYVNVDLIDNSIEGRGFNYIPSNSGGFLAQTAPGSPCLRSWIFTANGQEYVLYLFSSAGKSTGSNVTLGLTTRVDFRSPLGGIAIPPIKNPIWSPPPPWIAADWPLPAYRESPYRLPHNNLSTVGSFPVATAINDPTTVIGATTGYPLFTSSGSTTGSHTSGSFANAATNSPTSWDYVGVLPTGVSLNLSTGLLSWSGATAGTYNFNVFAINASGARKQPFTLTLT